MNRLWISVVLLAGCAENLVQSKVAVPSFEAKSEQHSVTRANVTVTVQPLGYAESESGKVPKIKASWGEVDRSQPAMAGRGGATKLRHEELLLIPVPSFAIAIVNGSTAPIDFKAAKIAVEGTSGKKFSAIVAPEDVASRVDLLTRERYPSAAQQTQLLEQLREAVTRLPLLTKETVVLPGQRFDGILVVDFGSHDLAEFDKALAADSAFVLTLDNLGGDAQPVTMKVKLDKVKTTITARCPEGKPATPQSCKLTD